MRKTDKYLKATNILSFSHQKQDELYQELNRLGWWWNTEKQRWIRDERLAIQPKEIFVRLWCKTEKASELADHIVDACEELGLTLLQKSEPRQCRPPRHLESRVYLAFLNKENDKNH